MLFHKIEAKMCDTNGFRIEWESLFRNIETKRSDDNNNNNYDKTATDSVLWSWIKSYVCLHLYCIFCVMFRLFLVFVLFCFGFLFWCVHTTVFAFYYAIHLQTGIMSIPFFIDHYRFYFVCTDVYVGIGVCRTAFNMRIESQFWFGFKPPNNNDNDNDN